MMRRGFGIGVCFLAVMSLTLLTGCPDERTSNQGGGSILTVAAKLASSPEDPAIGELNADEWQILTDQLQALADLLGIELPADFTLPPLTDEQAAALVEFIEANNIETVSDLEALIPAIEAGEVEVPEALVELVMSLAEDFFPAE